MLMFKLNHSVIVVYFTYIKINADVVKIKMVVWEILNILVEPLFIKCVKPVLIVKKQTKMGHVRHVQII